MPDRTIHFGESETEATYQIQDTDAVNGGGNFVVAKDTNANTVLLEYQPGSDTWQYAGDVDMGGGDITNVNGLTASSAIIGGTLTATDVNTDSVNTDDGTIGGAPIMGMPSSSSSPNLSFGSRTVVNSDQPVLLVLDVFVETDGSSEARIQAEVNEAGGTSIDYALAVDIPPEAGAGANKHEILTIPLPAGASILVDNEQDPAGNNLISADRSFVMSS